MTNEDKRIILSCFANGFEFRKNMEQAKIAEVKTLDGTETFSIEYMDNLAEMLCKALDEKEKQEKYRWHDLRKDPTDLPKTFNPVLITNWVKCDEPHIGYELGIYGPIGWNRQTNHEIVAWKEIEPFEED